jgi:hypothetical protein
MDSLVPFGQECLDVWPYRLKIVIIKIWIQTFKAPIMLVSAHGRLAWWQMHRIQNLPDNLSLAEYALIREKMKTLLSPVKDNAATRRSLVLHVGWHFTPVLEKRPIINMCSRMG